MHIGIIPARKGSKRFPGKNRAKIKGIPLWKIAANKSEFVMDMTIVNTDDPQIKPICPIQRYERPIRLAQDNSRIDDVILEMVATLEFKPDTVLHLFQPTSPFLSIETVGKAIKIMDNLQYTDSVQSIYKVNNTYHAYSQRIIKDGWMEFAYPEDREQCYNSQKKPNHFIFAGYVAFRVGSLLENRNIWGRKSIGIMVEELETFDIDTREDLENAIRFTGTDL